MAKDGNSLSYGFGSNSDPHQPDPKRPIEFLLIPSTNKWLESLVNKSLRPFKWNSGPIKIPFDNQVLIIRPTRDRLTGERSGFSWNADIEIENGGILLRDEKDRLPLAPVEGYQEFVRLSSERGSPEWSGGMSDGRLIFRTSQGLYGKIKIDFFVKGYDEDDELQGRVTIFLNHTGERYLD